MKLRVRVKPGGNVARSKRRAMRRLPIFLLNRYLLICSIEANPKPSKKPLVSEYLKILLPVIDKTDWSFPFKGCDFQSYPHDRAPVRSPSGNEMTYFVWRKQAYSCRFGKS